VLTHPGWWQEVAMPPRQRVFRCVFGRAKATMRGYDDGLRVYGRVNQFGPSISLNFLDSLNRELFELCDYLWNTGQIRTLLIELWRLHERQIYKLCKAQLRKQWKVPACQLNAFFDAPTLLIDGGALFKAVFSTNLCKAARLKEVNYRECSVLCNALIHGRSSERRQQVEDSCLFLCAAIESLVAWGQQRSIKYDGISQLDVIGIPTFKTVDGSLTDRLEEGADDIKNFPLKKWEQFKADILKVGAAGMAQVSLL
jgi:hypothetical protein